MSSLQTKLTKKFTILTYYFNKNQSFPCITIPNPLCLIKRNTLITYVLHLHMKLNDFNQFVQQSCI